jgi:hypothetical protein
MKTLSNLRSFALLVSFAFALTSFSHAILDTNNNGMSDLWEKQQNNGNLMPATFQAGNDDDQDGWNNLTESVAGTNPFEPNPPNGIVVTHITPSQTQGAYTLTWPTMVGKRYRLQASYDLDTWFSVGNSIFATDSSLSLGVSAVQPDTSVPPKIFWRIIVGDLDDDGDGLTNFEEFQAGTNALDEDTDGDGISDYEELFNGTNPNQSDTDGDGATDHSELVEGTDANNQNSHPPLFYTEEKFLHYTFDNFAAVQYLEDPPSPQGYVDKWDSWRDEEVDENEITEQINLLDLVDELPSGGFPNTPQRPYGSLSVHSAHAGSSAVITALGEEDPNNYYAEAHINHRRVWFKRSSSHAAAVATKLLITKSRHIFDGENLESDSEIEFKTLTIPPNGLLSNALDFEPTLEVEHSEPGTHFEHYDIISMPIEVRDGGRLIHSLPFNQDPWANSSIQGEVAPSSIAWITGNTGINNTPEMPKLTVALANGRSDIMVSWRFECEYRRGNGYRKSYITDFSQADDRITIPKNQDFTAQMQGSETWKIFEEAEWQNQIISKGLFGGLVKIFLKVGNEEEVEVCRFRIGGKNPDEAVARAYIDQIAGAEFWYAYAIAKHETFGRVRENVRTRYYNQFYTSFKPQNIGDNANDMGWAGWAHGWPLYNLDRGYNSKTGYKQNGPGGYGMYQLTMGPKTVDGDQAYETFITRDQIWNWQSNCQRAVDMLRQKKQHFTTPLVNALQSAYPTWPSLQNTQYKGFNGVDAANITFYNGMYGGRIKRVAGRPSCWDKSTKSGGVKIWQFLTNANDYVNKVNSKLD